MTEFGVPDRRRPDPFTVEIEKIRGFDLVDDAPVYSYSLIVIGNDGFTRRAGTLFFGDDPITGPQFGRMLGF
jgi:hypothetical protein